MIRHALITGGMGFIGRSLVKNLLEKEKFIYIYLKDNLLENLFLHDQLNN